jgi:hypothetical protein
MFLKHPIEIGNLIKKFIYKYNYLISMHILKFYFYFLLYSHNYEELMMKNSYILFFLFFINIFNND